MVLNAIPRFASGMVGFGRTASGALLLHAFVALGVSAQESGSNQCRATGTPIGWHGITSFVCNCSSSDSTEPFSGPKWDFRTEPEVLRIGLMGPADGTLEEGDRIVSIDGLLITTRSGGDRWSTIQPGETVMLRVRRDGRLRDISLSVGSQCLGDAHESRPAPVRDRASGSRTGRLLPRGWLGFGIECACSVSSESGGPVWSFTAPPIIRDMVASGPADVAGVRAGDAIIAIDGIRITDAEGGERFSGIVPGQVVTLTLLRGETEIEVTVAVGEHPSSAGAN